MSTGVSSKIYSGSSEFILDNSGSITSSRTFITAPTGICAVWEKVGSANGALHYIHTDNQGSWLKITSESATIENTYSYDAWGRPRNPSTWALKPISIANALGNLNDMQPRFDRGYTGHEQMAGFGLINMNGRLYDPYLQRFLSPDPFVQSPDNAQNYNRYTYCLNNPLAFTDPTGYIQQSAFADGCYELAPAYSAFQRAFGLQNFLLNAGRNNTMLAMNPLFAIGLLGNSTFGGSWSRSTGMSYYKSDKDGLDYGCAYNDYFNSWGNTAAGNYTNAQYAYVTGSIPLTTGEELSILAKEATRGCYGCPPPQSGGDYLIFNGKQVVWYNGDGGIVASYNAVSGTPKHHTKEFQQISMVGPIPEGSYTINLSLDPNKVARRFEGNSFYNDAGIMKVPDWMKNSGNNPWGNTMARLEPTGETNLLGRQSNFYMHDSSKGWTTGCIEIQSSFFTRLLDYRQNNSNIMVFVTYP